MRDSHGTGITVIVHELAPQEKKKHIAPICQGGYQAACNNKAVFREIYGDMTSQDVCHAHLASLDTRIAMRGRELVTIYSYAHEKEVDVISLI